MFNKTQPIWTGRDFTALAMVTALALAIRITFFTGFFGSDEVTYLEAAYAIYNGQWPVSTYNGSLRYGINIPMALAMQIFGVSEPSAALWGMLTSTAEVCIVYVAGKLFWNSRAATLAAIFLALTPLHANMAGRVTADPPLAFFITLAFLLLWLAEHRQKKFIYFFAGLATGTIFWMKTSVMVMCIPVFGLYALIFNRWHRGWLWMAGGALLMVALNCLLLWRISGDPFHVIKVTFFSGRLMGEDAVTSPSFYFKYLLFDIRHTWLLMYLSLIGGFFWLKTKSKLTLSDNTGFVLLWATGLLLIFSFLVAGTSPLIFVPKQTNYMLAFLPPLALLAGFATSKLGNMSLSLVCIVYCSGGLVLTALEQQAVRVFSANSRATFQFAKAHHDAMIFAGTGAPRAAAYSRIVERHNQDMAPIRSITELDTLLTKPNTAPTENRPTMFAIQDPQTAGWGDPADSRWPLRLSTGCFKIFEPLAPADLAACRT